MMSLFRSFFSLLRFKIAARNIVRHRLRSLLTIGMISGAVISIVLFHGLTDNFLQNVKNISAENHYGNMQIAREKFWGPGKEPRRERMFNLNELNGLRESHPEIIRLSGRLSFFGLVSTGDLSVGGRFIGVDMNKEINFKNGMELVSGTHFSEVAREGIVGRLLAKQMHIKPGDTITVLTNTIDGVMNAMDITVSGIFTTFLDEVDAQVVYLPLTLTQQILDTKDVDVAVIKFEKLPQADVEAPIINNELKKNSTGLIARTWRELATLYRQIEKFYSVQNRLIEAILLSLMFLGILNAVSMTVIERTGEIGTLRSFGENRTDIICQFLIESMLLTLFASLAGSALSWVIIQIIHASHIYIELPGASTPFTLHINFLFSACLYAMTLAIVTAFIATYIPARRAARMNIVDALRKNI